MKEFLTANGVKQITSSPYHPSSNGLVERAVQTCKSALKKMDGSSLNIKVQRFLLNYRTVVLQVFLLVSYLWEDN